MNEKCPECDGETEREEHGEYVDFVCKDCGNYERKFYDENNNLIED